MFKPGDKIRFKDVPKHQEYRNKNYPNTDKNTIFETLYTSTINGCVYFTKIDGKEELVGAYKERMELVTEEVKEESKELPIVTNNVTAEAVPIITMDKTYTTRDGRPVRILCIDAKSEYPVKGLVDTGNNQEFTFQWDTHGHALKDYHPDYRDLIEVIHPKVENTRWGIIYKKTLRTGIEYHMGSITYTSKEKAQTLFNNSANQSKVGIAEIKWEE